NDVVVGTIALRRSEATAEVVGPLLNLLPIRSTLEPRESFSAFVQRTSTSLFAALAHADVPFAQIVKSFRDHERTSFVRFVFNFIPNVEGRDDADDRLRSVPVDWCVAEFELTLMVLERANRLDLVFQYASDALTAADVETFVAVFYAIL